MVRCDAARPPQQRRLYEARPHDQVPLCIDQDLRVTQMQCAWLFWGIFFTIPCAVNKPQ